jgi:sodium-independent sulfate anion transporter 11
VFFYIPNAALSAVIIHALGSLITPPKDLYHWWKVSPAEVVIFFAGVIGTVFGTIEIGIYTAIASTAGLFLLRVAKSRGDFLGRVNVYNANSPPGEAEMRPVYLPFGHPDGSNFAIPIAEPLPGVFVYRPRQSPIYSSVGSYTDELISYIQERTKRTNAATLPNVGDRPWNIPGPRNIDPVALAADPRPTLHALIWDFTAVEYVDVTSAQILKDIRGQLDRYAAPDYVEWHFAGVSRPWVKRALAAAGFAWIGPSPFPNAGPAAPNDGPAVPPVDTIFSIAEGIPGGGDIEMMRLPVFSLDREAFHLDIPSAIASVESRHW